MGGQTEDAFRMTAPTTTVAPVEQITDDDDLSHFICECDWNRALCGRDVSNSHYCPEDLSCGCLPCVVCADLRDAACPQCGW